jgi:predicted Zn-dependent peptidase
MFCKKELKNGLRIIVVPRKNTHAATVLALAGAGSKYENKEINGISHFLEHMFFKGTKKNPSYLEVSEKMDKVGGMFNAFTSEEYTGYFAKVEASKVEMALDWVSDIYLNSVFPAKEINKERGVIIEEINMIEDHPMIYAESLWPKVLYGDQPAGRQIIGTKENIKKIKRKDLIEYQKSHYTASNTVICIAGNVEKEKAVAMAKKYFSGIREAQPLLKEKVKENQTAPKSLVLERKTGQTHFCLGVRGYDLFHPDRYVQDVLAIILGGMMSSRLFIKVREKLGLAYYVRTQSDADSDTGSLLTRAGVDNNKVERAVSEILKEYKRIAREKVPPAELQKAKDNLKGRMALSLEPSDALAYFYGSQELVENRILTAKEIFKAVDKISRNDVLRAAKDIFRPENLNLALIGPFDKKEKFQTILNGF